MNLGKTTVAETGELSQTELLIEIPESKILAKKMPVNYLGGENGKLGEILLETPPRASFVADSRSLRGGGRN